LIPNAVSRRWLAVTAAMIIPSPSSGEIANPTRQTTGEVSLGSRARMTTETATQRTPAVMDIQRSARGDPNRCSDRPSA